MAEQNIHWQEAVLAEHACEISSETHDEVAEIEMYLEKPERNRKRLLGRIAAEALRMMIPVAVALAGASPPITQEDLQK